jgi:hypothetical protein
LKRNHAAQIAVKETPMNSDQHVKPTLPPLPNPDMVHAEIKTQKSWILWRAVWDESKGKWKKPPCSPIDGSAIAPIAKYQEHFVDFDTALAACPKQKADGIGYVLNPPYVGIDFDNAIGADGTIHPTVQAWRKWFPSFTEISPSGRGIHIIGKGKIPKALTATTLPNGDGATCECYGWERYLTLTSQVVGTGLGVDDIQPGLDKLLSALKQPTTGSQQTFDQRPMTIETARKLYRGYLESLRTAPYGTGNATLNTVSFFAARAFKSGALEGTEESIKEEIFSVTQAWQNPHPQHAARETIASGWRAGSDEPIKLIEVAGVEELTRPDMPISVLCGKLGEICRTRLADFPIAYAWPSILAAASVLVHPHPTHRCNLYVATVGLPDSGKSEAQRRANYLFALDKKDGLVVDEKFGSAEGMLERIGDRKGDTVLWSPDELSHVLEKAQIQGASFPFILNTLFYNDRNNSTVAHRKHIPFNARVTIAGGVVEENFGNSFGSATTAGLYSRFLFGLCPSGFRYLYRPVEGEPVITPTRESVILPFGGEKDTVLGLTRLNAPGIHSDVWAARDAMYQEEKIEPRLLELCIRTAIICAAWDERTELRATDLEPAWELARYQHRVRELLRPNPGLNFEARAAHKIQDYLRRHADGEKWLVWRDVCRATHLMDFGPSVAERARDCLSFSGEIEKMSIRPEKGGREKILVRLARD